MKKIISFSALLGGLPMIAFAVEAKDILVVVQDVLNIVIPVLITLAVVYFIWGVIQYTISQDEEAKKQARSKIIAGLIGLFIIIAFWGIVYVIINTFNVGPQKLPTNFIPCIDNPQTGVKCP